MLKLELESEHEPILTYELVEDLGDNGTKTIYTSDRLSIIQSVVEFIKVGDLGVHSLDLDDDELELIETLGINVVLTSKEIELVAYDGEKSAMALVKSFKVVKE